ncbi:MAG: hypothetical protein QM749_04430 [Aquabacterium sp.]
MGIGAGLEDWTICWRLAPNETPVLVVIPAAFIWSMMVRMTRSGPKSFPPVQFQGVAVAFGMGLIAQHDTQSIQILGRDANRAQRVLSELTQEVVRDSGGDVRRLVGSLRLPIVVGTLGD